MSYKYVVLGAGMQGTAAAYDLFLHGDAAEITIIDADIEKAQDAVGKIRYLVKDGCIVRSACIDVTDKSSLIRFLSSADACLSAVPYFLNPTIAEACIEAKTHFNDLGGNTHVVREILSLNDAACDAGISLVPDCGIAPGAVNILSLLLIDEFENDVSVEMAVGGLPVERNVPLGYKLTFSPEGLVNEYTGKAEVIRNGKLMYEDTLTDISKFDWSKDLDNLEMFLTSGGTSDCPEKLVGRVNDYVYRTIRYEGHCENIKGFLKLGFFDVPALRKVFCDRITEAWTLPDIDDMILLTVCATGTRKDDGTISEREIRLVDRADQDFSAMERCTAFSASIITIEQARGNISPGASTAAFAIDPQLYYEKLQERNFNFEENTRSSVSVVSLLTQALRGIIGL